MFWARYDNRFSLLSFENEGVTRLRARLHSIDLLFDLGLTDMVSVFIMVANKSAEKLETHK